MWHGCKVSSSSRFLPSALLIRLFPKLDLEIYSSSLRIWRHTLGDRGVNQVLPGILKEMIVRSFGVQTLRQCTRRPQASRAIIRKFSTPSLASESSAPAAHPLVGVTSQFDHVAPRFEIEPSQIEILNSPSAFYETLKVVESDLVIRQAG